ncbi:MAG: Flp pilus assembly protein CpaB, partial [Gammaproteobacteria bacterium]
MASDGGSKVWLLLVGAIGFGIVAALFSALYLNSREEAIRQRLEGDKLQNVQVVVASSNLTRGTQIGQGSFSVREVPAEYVHSDVIYPAYFDANSHRFLAQDLASGKPLLASFLVDEYPIDFSDLVAQGLRAITLTIDDQGSQAAMMRPGNRIDIFVNVPTREAGVSTPTIDENDIKDLIAAPSWLKVSQKVREIPPTDIMIPVVQDIAVLATGREPYEEHLDDIKLPQQRQDLRYSTITIAVTPKQASLIRLAEDKGELQTFLRNRDDRSLADFVGVTPSELFDLATQMAAEAQLRIAAAAAGATIDKDGNWVSADGTVIKKQDLVISDNGTVTTKSGKLLAAKDVMVNEKGEFVDANGNVLRAQDVVTQTADGRFVDANGNEIPAEDLIIGADGSVKTKAQVLAEAGLTLNENGDYVDADGNVISKDDIVVLANGTVMTKDGKILGSKEHQLAAAGFTVNENGDYVDADGRVYAKEDLIIQADGSVTTKDGEVITGPPVSVNEQGFIVAADGTIMTPDGKVISGL